MELLIAPSTAASSGVATYVANQALALSSFRPHVLAPVDSDLAREIGSDVTIVETQSDLPAMAAAIRNSAPTLIHTHGPRALAAARAAGVPAAAIHHMFHELPGHTGRRGLGELALSVGVNRLANSPALANALRRCGFRPKAVLPPVVGDPALLPRAAATARLPESDATFRLAVIGRLDPVKKPGLAIDAMGRLDPDTRKVTDLFFIGDGPRADALRAQAVAMGVRSVFAGHVPAADSLLAAFDAVIVPSPFETFGFSMVAALLAGVPVVAVGSPGSRWVAQACPGFEVARADPDALSRSIAATLEHPPSRTSLAASVREAFQERSVVAHNQYFRSAGVAVKLT